MYNQIYINHIVFVVDKLTESFIGTLTIVVISKFLVGILFHPANDKKIVKKPHTKETMQQASIKYRNRSFFLFHLILYLSV